MRKQFHWDVTLSNGETRRVSVYWSPEKEGTNDAVMVAGMVEEWLDAGKPMKHANEFCVPIQAVRVDV